MPKPLPQKVWEAIHNKELGDEELWELAVELKESGLMWMTLFSTLDALIRVRGGRVERGPLLKFDVLRSFLKML